MADPIEAWEKGWLAHHGCAPDSECPYPAEQLTLQQAWRLGWRDAATVARQNREELPEAQVRVS